MLVDLADNFDKKIKFDNFETIILITLTAWS